MEESQWDDIPLADGPVIDSDGTKKWLLDGKPHRVNGPAIERADGSKAWYLNGKLHRVDGPAIEYSDKTQKWYLDGKLHRVGGPAVEYLDGTKEWYLNGKLHRVDGPAIEHLNGAKEWYLDDKLHRIGGPAIEDADGDKFWYIDDKLHRVDGPAIEYSDGTKEWYLNGEPQPAPVSASDLDEKKEEIIQTSTTSIKCSKLSKAACLKQGIQCRFDEAASLCLPGPTSDALTYSLQLFESRRRWREGVVSWLSDRDCNMGDYMKNIKVFTSKDSVSASIIVSGTIQPTAFDKQFSQDNNTIMKITFDPIERWENTLEVEIAIYRNIITRLVNDRNCPHVMAYLGYTQCAGKDVIMPKSQKAAYNEQVKKIIHPPAAHEVSTHYTDDVAHILYCERSNGKTWWEWVSKTTNLNDLLSIIFQVVYSLMCFARIGLQHNDLHMRNIFIEDLGRPVILYYAKGPNKYIELTTRWLVKIYDWDRGSIIHPAVPVNLGLTTEYCGHFGTCDRYNPKFDLFEFVAQMHQYLLTRVNPLFKNEIKANWMAKILNWDWYFETMNRETPTMLAYMEDPEDFQLKHPKDALKALIEAKWSITPPFALKQGDLSALPRELLFTPPTELVLTKTKWKPISNDFHISFYGEIIVPAPNLDYTQAPQSALQVWSQDTMIGINEHSNRTFQLLNEVINKKGYMSPLVQQWYRQACAWLVCYQFHRLNSEQQGAVINDYILNAVIDDIWNMFNNEIPIEITKYTLYPKK